MKILVINGDCIQTNTSANLCHLAYIRGLLDAGHEVTLLSADGRDYKLDESMVIPEQVKQHTYYGVSFYEKLSLRKQAGAPAAVPTAAPAGNVKKSGLVPGWKGKRVCTVFVRCSWNLCYICQKSKGILL